MYARSEVHGKEIFPSVFMGSYEVTDIFEDFTRIFTPPPQMGNELFPYRFRLKPLYIFETPVEVKPMIETLTFVKNKQMWSGSFRQAMREIPEEDYRAIIKAGT